MNLEEKHFITYRMCFVYFSLSISLPSTLIIVISVFCSFFHRNDNGGKFALLLCAMSRVKSQTSSFARKISFISSRINFILCERAYFVSYLCLHNKEEFILVITLNTSINCCYEHGERKCVFSV